MLDHARQAPRGKFVVLGLVLLASYAYFYEAGGWNQNSRFDLVRAILQQHALYIDAFHENTGDKAVQKGHVYSDKAPGLALSAVPIVAVGTVALKSIGIDPKSERGIVALTYMATVALDGVPTAVAAVCLGFMAFWLFGSESAATFAALTFGLATPAWAYATLFFGHALATGCVFVSFAAAVALPKLTAPRARIVCGFVVGIAAGWATVTEFTAAIPAVLMTALVLANERSARRDDWLAALVSLFIGAMLCAAVLMVFNALSFGSPFNLGYGVAESPLGVLHVGFFGVTYPKPAIIGELLVGAYRGLLPLAPALVLSPVGFWMWSRTSTDRKPLLVAALIPVYYLLLNASYFYWEGGWSYGPRHISPALPFLALALAPLWVAARRSVRFALAAVCVLGIGITLIGVSTTPQPPSTLDHPFKQLWWPAFLDGDLSLNQESYETSTWNPELLRNHPEVHQAWNLGELLGLRGLTSLVPLLAVWGFAADWWIRGNPRKPVANGR